MKRIIFLFIIFLVCQATMGQNYFSQQLAGPGGGQTDNASYQVSWSVGEPVTATSSGGSVALTQGFQQGETLNRMLSFKFFLEGLYTGSGTMNKAQDESGNHFAGNTAERVKIELHNALDYSIIEYSINDADLATDGTLFLGPLPSIYNGSYYVTIRQRNSIETTTALPVVFGTAVVGYDFSTAASQAYGDNQKDAGGGYYVIWSGDVNQDGIVDGGDMNPVDNASTAITFGYVDEDVNGDGIVDGGDMNIVDNNSTAIIMAMLP